jgi:hypothetical protein
LNVSHLEQHRLQTLAGIGEAMAITGVLFSGLGFVVLIATVWLQRTQVAAAIQSMEESTKAQQENLETLRAQSENTLAVAKISALAVRISAYTSEILQAGIMDPVKKIRLEEERKLLVEELDTGVASCCWIAIEKPTDTFTSGSNNSPANADVISPKKTIVRNMRRSYQ